MKFFHKKVKVSIDRAAKWTKVVRVRISNSSKCSSKTRMNLNWIKFDWVHVYLRKLEFGLKYTCIWELLNFKELMYNETLCSDP